MRASAAAVKGEMLRVHVWVGGEVAAAVVGAVVVASAVAAAVVVDTVVDASVVAGKPTLHTPAAVWVTTTPYTVAEAPTGMMASSDVASKLVPSACFTNSVS